MQRVCVITFFFLSISIFSIDVSAEGLKVEEKLLNNNYSSDAGEAIPLDSSIVLYIGASHSYTPSLNPRPRNRRLGNVLIDHYRSEGKEIAFYSACGASSRAWMLGGRTTCGYTEHSPNGSVVQSRYSFRSFPELVQLWAPQEVVFLMGDNDYSWQSAMVNFDFYSEEELHSYYRRIATGVNHSRIVENLQDLIAEFIGFANCTWIGPSYHIAGSIYYKPNSVVDAYYAALVDAIGIDCRIIDSRGLIEPMVPGDGLHLTKQESRQWGEAIRGEFISNQILGD